MKPSNLLHKAIQTLELRILDPEVRCSRELMNDLLAEDFLEIGQGGSLYTKKVFLDKIPWTAIGFKVDDFECRNFGHDHVLLIYEAVKPDRLAVGAGASKRC